MGEHVLGLEIGDEAKRLTFEDLEAGFRRNYENSARRSLRRATIAWNRLRDHFEGLKARHHCPRAGDLRFRAPEGGRPSHRPV